MLITEKEDTRMTMTGQRMIIQDIRDGRLGATHWTDWTKRSGKMSSSRLKKSTKLSTVASLDDPLLSDLAADTRKGVLTAVQQTRKRLKKRLTCVYT